MPSNWSVLITAGVVSALISAAVSFVGTMLTLRLQKRKDVFEKFFPQLQQMRKDLLAITTPQIGRISLSDVPKADRQTWFVNQLTEARDYFAACESLFVSNEMLFSPDIQQRLRTDIEAIYSGQDTIIGGVRGQEQEDIPMSSFTDDLLRKVAFAASLLEGIDEQMRRLSKHYI